MSSAPIVVEIVEAAFRFGIQGHVSGESADIATMRLTKEPAMATPRIVANPRSVLEGRSCGAIHYLA